MRANPEDEEQIVCSTPLSPSRIYYTTRTHNTHTHTNTHTHLRVHHVPHCMCQCQGTHQHIFRHLCLPGVSGHVCVSAFLLPKEMETIPGQPEFYLVCPLIAGLWGRREGGRLAYGEGGKTGHPLEHTKYHQGQLLL